MKLRAESPLAVERALVYRTYRDRLVELVPFLPNIRSIEQRERADDPPVTRIVNVWHGGGDIPRVVRGVLSDKMLSWTDHATWDESAWTCAWRMEAHSFRDAVHAEGTNRFVEEEGGSRLIVEGELTIDGKHLPIPRFLAGTVGPAVERFLVERIKPNLTETAKGVEKFLEAQSNR